MENNQENLPPVIQPQPPKQLDKKLFIIVGLVVGAIVIGYIAFNQSHVQQQVVSQTNIQDPTKDWKTYTNDQYGFEIKYPKDWIDTEHSYGLDVFQIKTENRKYNFFIQKNEKGGVDPLNDPSCFKEINKTTFNNINWSINEEGCGESGSTAISAFLYKDNLVYRILSETGSNLPESIEELNQILSTFKFISP